MSLDAAEAFNRALMMVYSALSAPRSRTTPLPESRATSSASDRAACLGQPTREGADTHSVHADVLARRRGLMVAREATNSENGSQLG